MTEVFQKAAASAAKGVGSPWGFITATSAVVIWAVCGPIFDFSDTWQLFINTGTTVITFLMVFIIQNSQNRDAKALHLKLDELIRSSAARDSFVDLEHATESEVKSHEDQFKKDNHA